MENTQTAVAESSPALQTFEIPSDPTANLEWRKTGELPAAGKAAQPKEDPAPSKTASPDKTGETAAESAPAAKQEKTHSTAADRLDEILGDLKRAGLSPAELKTFKREVAKAETAPKTEPAKTTEPTGSTETKPPAQLVPPTKPDTSQMTWEEAEAAKDEYREKYAEYVAAKAVQEDRAARAAEAERQSIIAKVNEAKGRYGDRTEATIGAATQALLADGGVPLAIQQVIKESPVWMDLMFVLGDKPAELTSFVALAKANPRAAIRQVIVMEQLIEQELANGKSPASSEPKGAEDAVAEQESGAETARDGSGKFVSAKESPGVPPPPDELNTRRSAPSDPIEAAVRTGSFAAFKAEEDRRDLARRRGA